MKTTAVQEQPGPDSIHRLIVETMTEAAFIVSFEGTIKFCNARFGQFVRWPLGQIVGRPLQEFVAPNSRAAGAALLIAAQEQQSVRQGLVLLGADGRCVPTHLSANVIYQPDGPSICIVASDLTEMENSTELIQQLRRHQEALRRSEEHARLALRAGRMGTWDRALPDGSMVWNEELFRLLGYPPGALTPSDAAWSDRIHRDDREEAAARFRRTLSVGGEFTSEYRVVWPEGTVRWVEAHGQTECDATGRPMRSYGVLQDVTERKESEETLRLTEQRFRSLFELSPDAVFLGKPEGTIVGANPTACKMFGMTAQELCQAGRDGIVDHDDPRVLSALGERNRSGRAEAEITCIRKNGERFPVEISSVIVPGDPPRSFVVMRDITRRKRAEEELRMATEELKRSNRDLEQFAYMASHDLQEPLRMVSSFLKLLREQYQGKLDAKAEQYIGFTCDGAERMSKMIKSLLEYSRAGSKALQPAPADFAGILEAARANLQTAIEESQARLTHDPLPTIAADAAQMTQVFQNLIGNAIKFRSPARPCHVHIEARRQDGHWVLSVRDNGIGIDPQQADRVFTLFQRLHEKEKYPGSGIGLAICKKTVERHGGRIWVESAAGEGSVFRFTLPDAGPPKA